MTREDRPADGAPREGAATLRSEADTAALGRRLASALRPGDAVFLEGPLGAGKSALARALIAARLAAAGEPEAEIPSPTYTLAQTYRAGDVALWHVDLYRLGAPEEAVDLGLFDAEAAAILLIEWPDRLGPYAPERRLEIALGLSDPASGAAGARRLSWRAVGDGWAGALDALRAVS